MQQFFNSLEDKIDLYKLCCNLFAGEAKFHEKNSSQKLFVDLNFSKGSNCLRFLLAHCNKHFSGRMAQSKTWWVELGI